jgi:hypothetical protein
LSLKFENSLPRTAGTWLTFLAVLLEGGLALYQWRKRSDHTRKVPARADLEKVAL